MALVMTGEQENKLYLTNNFSIISKYSAVKNQYFSDPILEGFVEEWIKAKSWRRAPIVNRGYAARLLAVDWAVDRALRCHNVGCAIILGAGYDMLGLRRLHHTCWIEIDLPQVIQVKIEFIKAKYNLQSDDISRHDDCIFSIDSLSYHLISCDIRETAALRRQLDTVSNLVTTRMDILIVNEVCLCYIDTESIEIILKTVIASFRDNACRAHYIGYEQIDEGGGSKYFGNVMLNHFSSMGHPLKHYPTAQEVMDLFKSKLAFQHVAILGMHNAFHNVLSEQIDILKGFSEEPFDEFEEMDLYLAHYKLIMATLIIRDPWISIVTAKPEDDSGLCERTEKSLKLTTETDHNPITNFYAIKNGDLQRFGHASCMLDSESILITGGFGTPVTQKKQDRYLNRQHGRISDCFLLRFVDKLACGKNVELGEVSLQKFPFDQIRLDRMHGQVTRLGSSKLFFNGGRQSPGGVTTKNQSFVAALNPNDGLISVERLPSTERISIWRHRQVPISNDSVIQIGGISNELDSLEDCIKIWNFGSSKLGCRFVPAPAINTNQGPCGKTVFRRHSFGLDVAPNGSMLFIWGGLQTMQKSLDKPVEKAWSKFIWDMRSDTVSDMSCEVTNDTGHNSSNCYGANIHFISDNQLIRIGGLNTDNGLEFGLDKSVELFDLRNLRSVYVDLREKVDCRYPFTLTNATSCIFDQNSEIVTIGGGGNYFTFGTCFQDSHLVYKYST